MEQIPGFKGLIDQPKITILTEVMREIPDNKLGFDVKKFCGDPDFVEPFIQAVPDREKQKKYLINSSKYENEEQDFDPNYVLFFRRTLPSKTPKPEERWTYLYTTVRHGLRREIPEGPHRLHSIILCESLGKLLIYGEKTEDSNPFTDGERVFECRKYDQEESLCKFKPTREKKELAEYLKKEGALSEEETLAKVTEHKSKI
ncbi:MAG: hypothetical protein PHQ18_00630 [Patescibacteria group bacterium]|nr:hypothetical protein [Patescibacteria group bacterium]